MRNQVTLIGKVTDDAVVQRHAARIATRLARRGLMSDRARHVNQGECACTECFFIAFGGIDADEALGHEVDVAVTMPLCPVRRHRATCRPRG